MNARPLSTDPALAAFAHEVGEDEPVAIVGARTRWSLGGELVSGTRTISAPSGIVDHVAEEMTVTVRAGTMVDELHAELASTGQWTALPERGGTVGGAIAVGENDFRRPARGELRSAVLQVRYVSDEGKIITGGGPTVKNVSGFDMPRLLTGSLGTLGCIGEVILRTNPIPASIRWFHSSDADPFVIHDSLLAPGSILWDGSITTVMLAGQKAAVDDDVELLAAHGNFSECEEPESPTQHRWSLTPSELRSIDTTLVGDFVAEVGVGIVHASKPQPTTALTPAVRLIHDRMKHEFDPTNRLNPGRIVGIR